MSEEFVRYPTVSADGVITHVMVPVDEYVRLTGEHPNASRPPSDADIDAAIAVYNDSETQWHDAESYVLRFIREGVEVVRKAHGLTQSELGDLIGMSQSQVSRVEKRPDDASVRLLRRIAAALAEHDSKRSA